VGEIAVSSRFLALGYHNDEAATAAAFVLSGDDDRLRTYRTGDIGRMWADGCLEYLGRRDYQPKLRGQRVEVESIERRMMESGYLEGVLVAIRESPTGEQTLVAYFVARATSPPMASQLRQHLRRYFPEAMVPSVYLPIEALPLTDNGKLDRKALPDPWHYLAQRCGPAIPPRTSAERRVAAICEEVLGIPSIGVTDDLLELGADSLRLMAIRQSLQATLGIELPLQAIFEKLTVAELAELIEEHSD
jgi:acyl carrier protein